MLDFSLTLAALSIVLSFVDHQRCCLSEAFDDSLLTHCFVQNQLTIDAEGRYARLLADWMWIRSFVNSLVVVVQECDLHTSFDKDEQSTFECLSRKSLKVKTKEGKTNKQQLVSLSK